MPGNCLNCNNHSTTIKVLIQTIICLKLIKIKSKKEGKYFTSFNQYEILSIMSIKMLI